MTTIDRRPWRNPMPRLGLAVLAASFALAACTAGGGAAGSGEADGRPSPGDGVAGDGTSTTLSPAAQSPTADDFNKLLTSEDGLMEPQQVQIVAVDETGPGVLLVSFEMASHHCYGVHAAVTETAAAVTLDLHTGRRPGASPASCPFGVFPYTTELTLAAPLGEREVATTAEATAQVDPATIPADELDRYVGHHVEDGVEWAVANERAWRILSEDGTNLADGSSDPARLSFTVVADVIVGYDWS
ncbi:MAG: hypothetical protein R2761_23095 [Acidimicrobiales bacterium]